MKFSHLDNKLKIRIIPAKPSIGLVIGTHGSPAYIHLFLESAKRNFPVPILIHDDFSQIDFKSLVDEYNCEFSGNEKRYGHGSGDITAYYEGLNWAKNQGIDILVKMSRRFIPFFDWRPSLINTALKSQHITYTNHCEHFKFEFRPECVGMYVPEWIKYVEDLKKLAETPTNVERDLMELISGFPRTCIVNESYANSGDKYCQYYGIWDIIGDNRMMIHEDILWHDNSEPAAYLHKARIYNISKYNLKDFII